MKLFIPTRNRPNSLGSVLAFIARFYPGQAVLIADGSFSEYKQAVHDTVAGIHGLDLQLLDYPGDLPLTERYVDALMREGDTLIAPCADDDYPLANVLAKNARRLIARPDLEGIMAASLDLRPLPDGRLGAKLMPCAAYTQKNVMARLRRHGDYHCVTNFGVFRAAHLMTRMRHFTHGYTTGFGDFEIAFTDLVHGRFASSQMPGYIRTDNPQHSKLRKAGLRLSQLGDYPQLMARLVAEAGQALPDMEEDAIIKMADRAIARFIGYRYQKNAVAEAARETIFEVEPVAGQMRFFDDLFREGTEVRERYLPQLRWAVDSLRNQDLANDNQGEQTAYETLDAMSEAGAGRASETGRQGTRTDDPEGAEEDHRPRNPARL